jgi:hypothetical protein
MGDGGSLIRSALRRLIVPLVLHQKRFDPVVVTLLQDPISDRRGLLRDGEALAESLGEGLQQGARELADGAVQRADRGRIEGEQPRILLGCRGDSLSRGLCWCRCPGLVLRSRLGLAGLDRWAFLSR